ncbi:MAG: CHASE2 domain-containing protein [Phycisphaerae bacterium]|nr:CHASE2 domain-containing protein [Phycisphaerae bacterium]
MAFSRVTFLAAVAGAAVTVGLGAMGVFSSLENQTIDWRYRNARSKAEPMGDRIALVAIDDKSNDYARWPWTRGEMAAAFREIALCGPKVIALDVFQSNPERGTDGDARLAAVIEEARAAGTQFVLAAEIGGAGEDSAARWARDPQASLALLQRVAAAPDASPFSAEDGIGTTNLDASLLRAGEQSPEASVRAATWAVLNSSFTGRSIAPSTTPAEFLAMLSPDRAKPVDDAFAQGRVDPAVRQGMAAALAERASWDLLVLKDVASAHARGSFTDRPPLLALAESGRYCGSVTAGQTDVGEMKRRAQLRFEAHGGHMLSLGLTGASLMLGVPPGRVQVNDDALVVGDRSLPLEHGLLRLDWPTSTFVGAVRLAGAGAEDGCVQLSLAGFAEAARIRQARDRIDARLRELAGPGVALSDEAALAAWSATIEDAFMLADEPDARLREIAALLPERARATEGLERIRREVAPQLKDKLVFVGWNATGQLADILPTIYGARTPGVFTHAVAADMVLQVRSRVVWPSWTGPAVGLGLALIAAWLVASTSALVTAGTVLAIAGVWLWAAGVVAFDDARAILPIFVPVNAPMCAWVSGTVVSAFLSARDRARIQRQFGARVAPELVERLTKDPRSLSMGGEERVIAVMFCDLAGFTTIAERLGGVGAVSTLNQVMGAMTDEVIATGGYVNKFLGDGLMAFWSAFEPQPDQAERAARAAMRCQERMESIRRQPGMEALSLRIGLSMGKAIVGDCGAPPRLNDYTAIGDVVNLAARLESANKQFGTGVLMDATIAMGARAAGLPGMVRLGRVIVVGQSIPVELWSSVPELAAADRATLDAAIEAFAAGHGAVALEAWSQAAGNSRTEHIAQPFLAGLHAGDADGVLRLRAK